MRNTIILVLCLNVSSMLFAQVGINTTTPSNASALDIVANDKGVLIPRVSLTATGNQSPIPSSVTPTNGLLVYNDTTTGDVSKGFYYWQDTKWVKLLATNDSKTYTTPWHRYNTSSPSTSNTNDVESNGTVTIGSPYNLGLLTVLTESGEDPNAHFKQITTDYNSGYDIDLVRARTNYSSTMFNGDVLGVIDFRGVNAVDANGMVQSTASFAQIRGVVDGTTFIGDYPSRLEFYTTPLNSTTPQLAMQILNDGVFNFPRFTNWGNTTDNNSPVIGIQNNGELVKIDRNQVPRMQSNYTIKKNTKTRLSLIDKITGEQRHFIKNKDAQLKGLEDENISALNVGGNSTDKTSDVSLKIVKNADDLTPLLLNQLLEFKTNNQAIAYGLEKGMVYRDGEGNLRIVF